MPHILRKVRIRETAAVDDGDNPGAHILIHKSRSEQAANANVEVDSMNPELLKALGLSEAATEEDVLKAIKAQKEAASVTASEVEALKGKVAEFEKAAEASKEPELTDVEKARKEAKAEVEAELAEIKKQLADEKSAREVEAEIVKARATYANLTDTDKVGKLIHKARKAFSADEVALLEDVLKAANGAAEAAGLLDVKGKSPVKDNGNDAVEEIAKRIQAEKGVTIEQARVQAMQTPEGRAAYLASL